jgi:LacI family transcriptional regulator
MSRSRATITEVARAAGVSVASASRALNGLTASPETRERVEAAARAMHYVADARARSFKTGKTMTLGYFVPDIGNPVYVEMMAAVETVTSAAGYRLTVTVTREAEDTADLVQGLDRGYVDGVLLSPLRVTDDLVRAVTRATVPITVLGSMPENIDVDLVRPDSARGVRLAVQHLTGLGHRRIAFINGPVDTTPGSVRLQAFRDAVARDASLVPCVVQADDFTLDAGLQVGRQLLRRRPLPVDAVIAANDLLAVGVMHSAAELGLRIPDDLAVVGMDDIALASMLRPALTSVDLGAAQRGMLAAEMLLARLQNPTCPTSRTVVAPSLSVRASTQQMEALR